MPRSGGDQLDGWALAKKFPGAVPVVVYDLDGSAQGPHQTIQANFMSSSTHACIACHAFVVLRRHTRLCLSTLASISSKNI